MKNSEVPANTQILVIGGGPAGSYAAAALAREGFQVVVLDAAKFPRYHIGESLLASVRPFLRFVEADDTVKSYGFTVKPGSAFKFNQYKREGYTDFAGALGPDNASWNVIRAEFDDLLLKHAAKCGATVIEETKVTELRFEGERPVSAAWISHSGAKGQVAFEYLVDASGKNGMMCTKYLHNRHFNKSLNNIACWGYWEGSGSYMPGTSRANAAWTEALPDETGWAWLIPLHDGSTSVGIVMDQDSSNRKKKKVCNTSGGSNIERHYLEELRKVPGVMKFLASATLRGSGQPGAVKSASDYSYSAPSYAGDHYRIAGDAGAFIDPFFSSGVHLAFIGGLSAAITISASVRGLAPETVTQHWHTSKVGESYTRFLLIVLAAYKQIHNQSVPVMSDIDEDNFDRAFGLLRPVIQGTADVGKTLTEDELQKTMDFCNQLMFPINPEIYKTTAQRITPQLMDSTHPIMTLSELDAVFDPTDEEARHVLGVVNARKAFWTMHFPVEQFTTESHFGFKAVLERGRLGFADV